MSFIRYNAALAAFKSSPSDKTAADLLTACLSYWDGPAIPIAYIQDDIILVRDWLGRNKGVQHAQ